MIKCSIDVTLINKGRLKTVTRKSGAIAKFLELALIETPTSEYGDYMVVESITKEEREAGKKSTILGNGRNVARAKESVASAQPQAAEPPDDGEVPF